MPAVATPLPMWLTNLRNSMTGEFYGPPLGKSILARLDNLPPEVDRMQELQAILNNVVNVTIADAVGAGVAYNAKFIPGHVGFRPANFGEEYQQATFGGNGMNFKRGPRPECAEVMVVGKHPGTLEVDYEYLFVGQSGKKLHEALSIHGIDGALDRAYVTNICKFPLPEGSTFKKAFVKECM